MPHHNTVFHTMLKRMPWDVLEEAVVRHGAAECARRFSFKGQATAMLFAQFSGASSLRHVENGLQSHRQHLYHLGIEPPRRSTLADANRDRPAAIFIDVLSCLIGRAQPKLRRAMDGVTCLVDSTTMPLNQHSADWARFSADACGAKLHLVYDPDANCPLYAAVTPSRTTDMSAAKDMPITPGATYVFDLGYYSYAWWAELDAAGCRFVTRLKKNTPHTVSETRAVAAGSPILSDQVGCISDRLASNRRNPWTKPIRVVVVRLDTGRVLRIATNDLLAPAEEIAALYKRRWAIELFFRWIKQVLKVTRFVGTSENAIRVQIAIALIAFLLLRLAHQAQTTVESPLAFARLVGLNLFHSRDINHLHEPSRPGPPSIQQPRLI